MKDKLRTILKEDGLTIAIVLGLIVAYLILRTPGADIKTISDVEAAITAGRPTVVQFYANNCSICLVSKPKVDQLERDLESQASLLRLNVRNDPGKALAYKWGVASIPTFFVFDGNGEQVYRRSGAPDVIAITDAVAAVTSTE
ncbi:MAG: thioredoxin family protein [Anaerolineae bacterium]|nr:thioredoxin family protein [Anaerolineae bacterium]